MDAVRRAHEEELQAITERMKKEQQSELSNITIANNDATRDRQSKMIEQITSELTNLSAMYSQKCLENSQLDEKMQALLIDKENQAEREYVLFTFLNLQ